MAEDRATRLRRLALRSMRRGIREMDLILGPFGREALPALPDADLDLYEDLLEQSDHDLYAWIAGRVGGAAVGPERLGPMLDRIAAHLRSRLRPA
jgi:antitoxin CptB